MKYSWKHKQWLSIKGSLLQEKSLFISKFKQIYQNLIKMNAENGSASEGSSKEYQTDSSPGPSTGKPRRRRRRRSTKYSDQDFQGSILNVCCGDVKGVLDKEKFATGVSQKCIQDSHGKWLTPVEFEASGDRARWKNWRKSITCKGFPLEKLIEEGDLPKLPREYRRRKQAYLIAESRPSLQSNPKRCSGSILLNTPGTWVGRRRKRRRNLSTQMQHRKYSELPGKGPANTNVLCYLHSPPSLASSSSTSPLTYDDNLGGVTLSPSPPLSSKAITATSQLKLDVAEMNAHLTETATALSLPLEPQQQQQPKPASMQRTEEEEELPIFAESVKEQEMSPLERSEEAAAAVEPQVKATAVPMPGQRRRQHRLRAQCHCSALAPRVLARIRALRGDMQAVLGQNVAIQDSLLYLEGNARATWRILQGLQRTMATQDQHCTPSEAAEMQVLLEQVLGQNNAALVSLHAIMAKLGIAPFVSDV